MKISPAALLPLSVIFAALAVGLTFGPSLGCFYFSEDLIQVWLASQELTIHPEVIWQHFTMPWFQCSNMGLFYRPVVEMSFLSDFLIYGRQAAGFHLTNLACHLTSTVMCLLITRLLTIRHISQANVTQATLTGLIAALLFGLYPLHCETVYWLVCRCDCFCTMFSLAAVYLGLLSHRQSLAAPGRKFLVILSVVACLLGALAKEQALFVPFVLLLYYWMYPDNGKASAALSQVAPYFVMLAIYTAVRLIVLGGIGGYHGTIGFLLSQSQIDRLFSAVAWSKIFYPMDLESFSSKQWCAWSYSLLYCLMALGYFFAWRKKTIAADRYKLVRFLIGGSILVLIPAYQSFVIIETLFGSRCIYMSQVFISMAAALLLVCLRPILMRNILLPTYLLLFVYTTVVDGDVWVARGENLRALQGAVNQWAQGADKNRKLCLLNMPLDNRELSSLYDLEQLRCLLKPPINDRDLSDRIVQSTYMRMSPDAVNSSRLQSFLADGDVDFIVSAVALRQPFTTISSNELRKHFQPIDTTVSNILAHKPPEMRHRKDIEGYELCLDTTPIPQRADCVEVTVAPVAAEKAAVPVTGSNAVTPVDQSLPMMRAQPLSLCPHGKTVLLLWHTDLTVLEPYLNWSTAQFIDDGKPRTYIFPLADRISWKYASKVLHVVFGNLPVQYKIVSIRLRNETSFVPTLKAVSQEVGPAGPSEASGADLAGTKNINNDSKADGFFAINDKQQVQLTWDASKVEGASTTKLQLSLPDFVYANYADGFREFELEKHSLKTIDGGRLCGEAKLTRADFPMVGKYSARLSACDKNGQVIGFCSDPIDLMVTDAPFAGAFDKAVFNLRAQPHR